ncbi:MAG: MinD/ParA family protein [Desulfobacterales bacterium]|nr:MAG: MinD/ParA family protein [Desulfobacterales bacterium]
MRQKNPSKNVISLVNRIGPKESKASLTQHKPRTAPTRVIAITSGKGGVGKTNIVANLGYAFSNLGKSVFILDADLGLGNLDVLLGLAPKYNLSHVILGEKTLPEIVVEGPGKMKILPASSGVQELTHLTREQKIAILTALDELIDAADIFIIDTAAGISSNVMDFNVTAHEIVVVVSPEPTSITDAYALMKVLALKYFEKRCKVLVNLATTAQEGEDIFRQLNRVTDRFLNISIEYLGYVLFDEKVTKGVKHQRIISELYPDARASRCFADLAQRIANSPARHVPRGDTNFFWRHLVSNSLR